MRRVLCFLALAASTAGAQTSTPPVPAIVTSATGEARTQPDRATILFAVETRAATAAAAGTQNARLTRQVIDTLRGAGLTAEQISTIGYSVSPDYQYSREGGAPRVVGYVARNTVRAEVQRVEQAGALIDAALARGSNSIGSLRFYSSREDEVRRSALAAAVTKARADAEAMARAAGGTLGPPIEMSSGFNARPVYAQEMAMSRAAASAPMPTPIEAGEQTIMATVTVRWTFVPQGR